MPINWNKTPKMTNSTAIAVTFEGASRNRVVPKQEDSHSTGQVDKL